MKKVIFIIPTGRYSLGTQICAPSRLLLIPSYVKKYYNNVEFEILDLHLWGVPINEEGEKTIVRRLVSELREKIDEETMIGFSVMASYELVQILPMLAECRKNFDNPVILGGYVATTSYKLLLKDYHHLFDAICLGAGEIPVLEMLRNFDRGRINYEKVPNLVYWQEGEIKENLRVPPPGYDELPEIDFSLLKDHLSKYNAISVQTSRGCAWSCEFCQEKKLYPKFSVRSAEKVEKDLANLRRHTDKRLLTLSDPLFGLDYKSSRRIVEALNHYGFNYQFGTRCDVFNEQLYKDMKGNCRLIFFGLESVSHERLLQMSKTKNPSAYIQQMKEQLHRCFENDVFAIMAIIINYPHNTKDDVMKVMDFGSEVNAIFREYSTYNGYLFRTYPFYIYYGDYYYSILEDLVRDGITYHSVYPPVYHGIEISQELELEVLKSSSLIGVDELYQYWNAIHYSSKIFTDKCKDILRGFYGPNLSLVKESREVNPDLFSDKDGNIINLSNIIENLDELDSKYPQYKLKDPTVAYKNPFNKGRV